MPARTRHKLTIADLLTLVAAIAVGLAWAGRFALTHEGGSLGPDDLQAPGLVPQLCWWVKWAYCWGLRLSYVMAPLGMALLFWQINGKPHSESWLRWSRRMIRHPGLVAGGAVSVLVAWAWLNATLFLCLELVNGDPDYWIWREWVARVPNDAIATAITATWTLLVLSGRWRRDPGWLDAATFGLGLFWLILATLAEAAWLCDLR